MQKLPYFSIKLSNVCKNQQKIPKTNQFSRKLSKIFQKLSKFSENWAKFFGNSSKNSKTEKYEIFRFLVIQIACEKKPATVLSMLVCMLLDLIGVLDEYVYNNENFVL